MPNEPEKLKSAMTPEQQRIAIAEWMGLILPNTGSSKQWEYDINAFPDYPNDLNAMHEAEKKLPPHKRGFYNAELSKLASNRNLSSAVKEPEFIFMLLNATSQQRSEALCRTLWPERFEQ